MLSTLARTGFARLHRAVPLACGLAAALTAHADPATLNTHALRFTVSTDTGAYEIMERVEGVVWRSNPFQARFGEAELETGGRSVRAPLDRCTAQLAGNHLALTFRPVADADAWLRVHVYADAQAPALDFFYEAPPGLTVKAIRLLDQALGVSDADGGGVAVPVREGLFIPANSGKAFTHVFDTYAYEGCHMAMLGVLKRGTVALVHWRDPYVSTEVRSTVTSRPGAAPAQFVAPSLVLRGSARGFRVEFLGRGDVVTLGQAYRAVAQREGWWVPWSVKLAGHPDRAKLFGASNYKLWSTLDRQMNADSTREESMRVNWTFDEAAQIAEHLKRDLELDKVLFLMGGWIHRGYDNQHPDILPAAPECGGDAGLADCARRVMHLGYLFGLHDNYQDIYRDSPSWNEALIMKNRDGSLAKGGKWAGGQAYLTCSRQALALAERPQNLPAVRALTGADAYFIDTTYAAGLMECFDPAHPLNRLDDLYWKQALSDYARGVFGLFGSECGREWAIPHSDFFEGLTGVSGHHYHNAGLEREVGGVVVPLFEAVYRDCIAMYGKYGYDIRQAAPYVLDHVLWARPLNYHNVPPHLYWQQTAADPDKEDMQPSIGEFEAAGPRQLLISYRWNVRRVPAKDWRVLVHFTTPEGEIAFQDDFDPATPARQWNVGTMEFGTFRRSVPESLQGTFDIRMGLYNPATQRRAELSGRDDGTRRYTVGRLTVQGDQLQFQPVAAASQPTADPAVFVSGDGGWTAGRHPFDRFVKNTHEILSPLNEITAQMPLTQHAFLSADRKVQRTVFGAGRDAVTVTVNAGECDWPVHSPLGGDVVLPPYGFLAEARGFVTFHASSWAGHRYPAPVLFTLRSLDGKPLARSAQVRVFHAFGDAELTLGGHTFTVPKQAILNVRGGN